MAFKKKSEDRLSCASVDTAAWQAIARVYCLAIEVAAGGEHLHSAATPTLIADLASVGAPVATVVFGASA